MDLLLSKNTRWKIPKITHARHFVSNFLRKVLINNYRFQLLVVSAALFYPVWRGLDKSVPIHDQPEIKNAAPRIQRFWKLDKGESTVVVAVTASHCPGLKPSVKYLFWVVQNQYKETQQLRRQRQMKAPAAEAVTTALCPGPGPSDNTYSEESSRLDNETQ